MAGRSWIRFGLQENVHTALLHVNVLAEYLRPWHRPGAAWTTPRSLATARGRTTLQSFHRAPGRTSTSTVRRHAQARNREPEECRPRPGESASRSGPATGWNRWTRFSALDAAAAAEDGRWLPWKRDALLQGRGTLRAAALDGQLSRRSTRTQLAVLMSRMSTDTPAGGAAATTPRNAGTRRTGPARRE